MRSATWATRGFNCGTGPSRKRGGRSDRQRATRTRGSCRRVAGRGGRPSGTRFHQPQDATPDTTSARDSRMPPPASSASRHPGSRDQAVSTRRGARARDVASASSRIAQCGRARIWKRLSSGAWRHLRGVQPAAQQTERREHERGDDKLHQVTFRGEVVGTITSRASVLRPAEVMRAKPAAPQDADQLFAMRNVSAS